MSDSFSSQFGVQENPRAREEQLSSSVPTVSLKASLGAVNLLATVINKFLEAWERIKRIRKARDEITDLGLPGPAIDHLTQQITETVEQVVEESTEKLSRV
jgi:hypothetical protein